MRIGHLFRSKANRTFEIFCQKGPAVLHMYAHDLRYHLIQVPCICLLYADSGHEQRAGNGGHVAGAPRSHHHPRHLPGKGEPGEPTGSKGSVQSPPPHKKEELVWV